jgi:hypothetical protein
MPRLALFLFLLAASGCTAPTSQLVVVVDSDLVVPTELGSVRVTTSHEGTMVAQVDFAVALVASETKVTVPFSFGVVPVDGDASRRIRVVVEALDSLGAPVVSTSASVGFIRGRSLVLPMYLAKSCIAIECPSGQTCTRNGCVPETIDPETLMPVVPGTELRPDANGLDASGVDASGLDAGARDGGPFDSGQTDGGAVDLGRVDGGGLDLGLVDGGPLPLDGGPLDLGLVDGGPLPLDLGPVDGGPLPHDSGPVGVDAGGGASCAVCGALGHLCDRVCAEGTTCTCGGACACDIRCTRGDDCATECLGSSQCSIDAKMASNADLVCGADAVCDIDARNASNVDLVCSDRASCAVDCTGVSNCFVACTSSATCTVDCTSTSNCSFTACGGAMTSCPDGVIVCNTACP